MEIGLIIQNTIFVLSVITAFKYLLYVISSRFYHLNTNKYLEASKNLSQEEIEEKIKISVIVPARNEEVGVLTSIKSLLLSTHKNMEIIVVDDGSTDDTGFIVRHFIASEFSRGDKGGRSLKYFYKENGGKGSALNYGILNSSGNVIVTMDADTKFEDDALSHVARYFIDQTLDAGVGNVKVGNNKSFLGLVQQIEYTIGFYFKRTHSVFNSEYIIGGAFGVFRRDCFTRFGYFDETNKTEDIEYSTRLQVKGCNIIFIEDAIAFTESPETFDGLMKQRLRWKKGRLDTFIKHKSLFFKRSHGKKFLTHFLLPTTLFYEFELIFEPIFTAYGIYFLIKTGNFYPLLTWTVFTGTIYLITFLFGSKKNSKKALLLMPTYFLLSYILTFVEVYAVYKSINLFLAKKDVSWQSWKRKGI